MSCFRDISNVSERGFIRLTAPDYSPSWRGSPSGRNVRGLVTLHPQATAESNELMCAETKRSPEPTRQLTQTSNWVLGLTGDPTYK